MNPEQAFKNICIVANRAQKAGLLELAEAVATVESLKVVESALGIQVEPAEVDAPAADVAS
jgi:hypothetical protein